MTFRSIFLIAMAFAVAAGSMAGCNGIGRKVENPVLTPPPMRVSGLAAPESSEDELVSETDARASDVQLTSAKSTDVEDDTALFNASVVAKVNGAPVFAGEILERYGDVLRKERVRLPPEQFEMMRKQIIQRDLRNHIERRIVVERMKSSLTPDQIKAIEGELDKQFESEIERLKRDLKVNTKTELEIELNKRGTSLAEIRSSYGNQQIALQYLIMNSERPKAATREDLLAYYRDHEKDYAFAARVKWRQIELPIAPQGQELAKASAEQAARALEAGQPFEQVAKRYSKGPKAQEGGDWGWMQKGSLASTELENWLFTIPVGRVSEVKYLSGSYRIIQVVDRQEAGQKPFSEVQEEIRKKLEEGQRNDQPRILLEKLLKEAVIETTYDIGLPAND